MFGSFVCLSSNELWSGSRSFGIELHIAEEKKKGCCYCYCWLCWLICHFCRIHFNAIRCLNCVINLKCVWVLYGKCVRFHCQSESNKDEYHSWFSFFFVFVYLRGGCQPVSRQNLVFSNNNEKKCQHYYEKEKRKQLTVCHFEYFIYQMDAVAASKIKFTFYVFEKKKKYSNASALRFTV